jgi:hypothetical protein
VEYISNNRELSMNPFIVEGSEDVSIRPVDFQSMVPKVNERVKVQNEEQQRLISQQQQNANSVAKEAQEQTSTVKTQEDVQKSAIEEKEEMDKKKKNRKNQQKYKMSDEQIEKENASKKLKQPTEGRTIDIRI